MTVKRFHSDTRYTKTVWMISSDKQAAEQAAQGYLSQYPTIGYSTSVKPTTWNDTDKEWVVEISRAHHCD